MSISEIYERKPKFLRGNKRLYNSEKYVTIGAKIYRIVELKNGNLLLVLQDVFLPSASEQSKQAKKDKKGKKSKIKIKYKDKNE